VPRAATALAIPSGMGQHAGRMDYYADVLDYTGRTPREFGAIHLHVEPVTRGPLGDAVAVLWLQSAFEPLASSGHSLLVMGRQKQGSAQPSRAGASITGAPRCAPSVTRTGANPPPG